MKKQANKTKAKLLLLLLSIGFALFISFVFAYWSGYPRGGDAIVHSLKIFWVEQYFPHHSWWHVWVGGMPHFLYYPVYPYLLFSFIAKTFAVSPELVLAIATVVAIGLSGFFLGLLVYHLSGNIFASVFTSFVAISVPAVWFSAVVAGSYMRVVALPFMLGSFYFAVKQALSPERKLYILWTIIFLILTFTTHPLIGLEATGLSLVSLLFISRGLKTKSLAILKTFIPLFLLLSFYLLPVFIFSSPANYKVGYEGFSLEKVELPPINNILGIYYQPSLFENKNLSQDFTALTPFVVPALILFLSIALLVKRELLKNRATLVFLLASALFLVFSTIKIPILIRAYFFIGPAVGLAFLTMFAAPTIGILIGGLDKRLKVVLSIGLIMVLLAWIWLAFSPNPQSWPNQISAKDVRGGLTQFFEAIKPPENSQFRFGTSSDAGLAMIFNRVYPDYPQTRDYFANGILNDDFNFYFVKAVWDWEDNLDETNFLLDWWAVDKFIATGQATEKLKNFNTSGHFSGYDIYEYGQASPILSAVNTPSILFVGTRAGYMVFMRALAQGNINSGQIIPVWSGADNLRNLPKEDLAKFSAIFIYDIPIETKDTKSIGVLRDYVKGGGRLFIDGLRGDFTDLPEPLPIQRVEEGLVEENWQLARVNYSFDPGFEDFSPPRYQDGPWGVGVAQDLYPWAEVLITEFEKPLIVGGKLGEGKIIWSGMNLPYHIDNYQNKQESLFFKSLFDWLQDSEERPKTDYEVDFVNPEQRKVSLKGKAHGVLFKEAYFPNWHAYLKEDGATKELRIYSAGPDFMFIPLGSNQTGKTLVLEYKKSPVELATSMVSFATFLGLILWFFDWWIFKPYVVRVKERLALPLKRVARWWEREEE